MLRTDSAILWFGPYRLVPADQTLWRGSDEVHLRSKSFAVLHYLAANSQRLVRREELASAIWQGPELGESVLRGYIRDLRRTLDDPALEPRYIETIAGHGYRFVAEVRVEAPASASSVRSGGTPGQARSSVVGRERELAGLDSALDSALAGNRQIVFVTGATGIGKTTLLDAFLERCEARSIWVARSQCVEQFGGDEPYLPWLDALVRLGQGPNGRRVVDTLEQHAPAWLAQLPALVGPERARALGAAGAPATHGRLLRELSEALELLTRERPLLLALDDLQWADKSSIDFISLLARRHEKSRLMLLGSCRRADLPSSHPLKRALGELKLRGEARELPLGALELGAIRAYLDDRFPAHDFPPDLAVALHRNTAGTPLFLVALLDDLVERKMLSWSAGTFRLECTVSDVQTRTPPSLRELVDDVIDRLSVEEQGVLEAASILGPSFTPAATAATLEVSADALELVADSLARRGHLLRFDGPENAATDVDKRYACVHPLYQHVARSRIPSGRLKLLHTRAGRYLESAHQATLEEHAPQLAVHFEHAGDGERAARYHRMAGDRATRCFAHTEASRHFQRALELTRALPDSPERDEQELCVLIALSPLLLASRGFVNDELEDLEQRALALARKGAHPERAFTVLSGIWSRCFMRADYERALVLAAELEQTAREQNDRELIGRALLARVAPLLCSGRPLEAEQLSRQAVALHDPERGQPGFDQNNLGIVANVQLASVSCILGRLDAGLLCARRALELADASSNPWGMLNALMSVARTHVSRRELSMAKEFADRALRLAEQNDLSFWRGESNVYGGWADVMLGLPGGLERLQRGLEERIQAARVATSVMFTILASACAKMGAIERGLRATAYALRFADENGELSFRSDVLCARAELLLEQQAVSAYPERGPLLGEAERLALEAKEFAATMGAKMAELRATRLLARLWLSQGRDREARSALAPVVESFREGLSLPDLVEARELLETPFAPHTDEPRM